MLHSHAGLLTAVDEVRSAAASRDLGRLHRWLGELMSAYVEHVDDERSALLRLPTFSARLVQRGQERIFQELVELSVESERIEAPCQCSELSEEIALRMTHQADAEERAFERARRPAPSSRAHQ